MTTPAKQYLLHSDSYDEWAGPIRESEITEIMLEKEWSHDNVEVYELGAKYDLSVEYKLNK